MPVPRQFRVRGGPSLHVTWVRNTKSGSAQPVKSNHCDEGHSEKIILPDLKPGQEVPQPGQKWVCEFVRETHPEKARFGIIWVRPVERILDEKLSDVWCDPIQLKMMIICLENSKNVMMVGPQGTGKSTRAWAVAQLLSAQYRKVSGGTIKKAERMLGSVGAGTRGEQLKFTFNYSQLTLALKEAESHPAQTFVVHIDEWHRIDEDARDMTLDVLEGIEKELHLPDGDTIRVGANVYFVASGNVGSAFNSRKTDSANNDRWEIFEVFWMPRQEEFERCLKDYPTCPKDALDLALRVIERLRNEWMEGNLTVPTAPSTRRSLATAMYLSSKLFERKEVDLATIFECAVANQYQGPLFNRDSDAARVMERIKAILQEIAKEKTAA